MLIPVRNLVDRLRHPRSRARELVALRAQLAVELRRRSPCAEETALARRMRELRVALSGAVGDVDSCGRCARGMPAPEGVFDGGQCCGGPTEDRFSDEEVAALAIGGTRSGDWVAPRTAHAGCAFRGRQGCTLDPAHRPNICALYLCRDLRRELHARGDAPPVQALLDELDAAFARFVALRNERLLDEELAAIDPRLVTASRR